MVASKSCSSFIVQVIEFGKAFFFDSCLLFLGNPLCFAKFVMNFAGDWL